MSDSLRISGRHHGVLQAHLFPGDGLEAVAFALCGRLHTLSGSILTVQRVVPVSYDVCTRASGKVTWPGNVLASILDETRNRGLAVVKVHSHPTSYKRFSATDDQSDSDMYSSVSAWTDGAESHGSAIMLPDGRMFGRSLSTEGWQPFSVITVVGDSLSYWYSNGDLDKPPDVFEAQDQLFGAGTTKLLRKLRIGVVGCSGTGSVVIEQLARLGVGTLVLIDDETVEKRNLNRIANAKYIDVGKPKVVVLAEAVNAMGLGTKAVPIELNLYRAEAAKQIATCDVVFGCMDSAEGRHLLNRIATFYLVPYFDLGVHLAADGQGGINEASGVVHYLQPGGSSLLSRKAYTLERVRAENLYRTNPREYEKERKAGYIEGVDEKSPAVISVNSTVSSLAVNEFLARIHPFRSRSNSDCAILRVNLMEMLIFPEAEGGSCGV